MNSFDAKKYFIFGFRRLYNNENKFLVKTEMVSLSRIIDNLILIIEDYIFDVTNDRLKHSLKDYLKVTEYYFKQSIINNVNMYKLDLTTFYNCLNELHKNLQSNNKNNISKDLLNSKLLINMLKKKISNNTLFESVVDIIHSTKKFYEVDQVLSFMINELIYEGHSLKYIAEWCSNKINYSDINEVNIDTYIDIFKDIKKSDEFFSFYLSIYDYEDVLKDITAFGENIFIDLVDYESFNNSLGQDYKNHLQNANKYQLYKIDMPCKDVYSGLKSLNQIIYNFYQLPLQLKKSKKKVILDKVLARNKAGLYIKLNNRDYDQKTLYSIVESKEKRDIKRFIDFRNKMYTRKNYSDELLVIQRSLNLINNSDYSNSDTKLINMWSAAEYILTYREGSSIIGKIKDTIPKLVVMYFMHEKLNSFWYRLLRKKDRLKNPTPQIIIDIYQTCKISEDRYDTYKLAKYIVEKGKDIAANLDFDIVLKRDVLEIGSLLTNKELRQKTLERALLNSQNELIYIYRLRNMIVHAAKKRIEVNDLDCLRLYQYNNNLLGIIIYYKDVNVESTLSEILASIPYSFNNYFNNVNSGSDINKICRPDYLLL